MSMDNVEVDIDSTGMNLMRSVGQQLRMLPAYIDFSDITDYPDGGVDISGLDSYFDNGIYTAVIPPKNDNILEYDEENKTVIVQEATENEDVSSIGKARMIVYGF